MPPLSTLLAWADAHWYAVPLVAAFLGTVWKLVPQERRDHFEHSFPRLVGLVRLVYTLGPDLVGAWLTLRTQLVAGEPKRGAK